MSRGDEAETEKPMIKVVYPNEDSASGCFNVPADSWEAKIVGNSNFSKESIDG